MGSTVDRRPMGAQDALWLEMDRPTNLMVVDSLVWTAEPIDWDRFADVARERLWDRYQVFRSLPVRDGDHWFWEEADDDFDAHVSRVKLPPPGDDRALQAFVAEQRSVPLDRDRPLWTAFCIDGFGTGSALLLRTHHAIADGIRMVQVAMSLFDASPEGGAILAPPVRLHAERNAPEPDDTTSPVERLRDDVRSAVDQVGEFTAQAVAPIGKAVRDPAAAARDGLDAAGQLADVAGRAVEHSAQLAAQSVTNPLGAAHTAVTESLRTMASMSRRLSEALSSGSGGQGPIVDVLSASPGDVDFVRKLLFGTRNDTTIWTGSAGDDKRVAWTAPIPLDEVKAVAKRHGATVNDVLVTSIAGALHAYLADHEAICSSATFMIPVNLRPLDLTLPAELGNEFAVVQLELPTDHGEPLAVLDTVRRRMRRIKGGHEAALAFRLQEMISGLGGGAYRASVDLLANRGAGVMTNVPGPPMPVYLAGQQVECMVGWAPLSGDQPMSFTIHSYKGEVVVGIACDAALVPGHEQLVDDIGAAFDRLAVAVR